LFESEPGGPSRRAQVAGAHMKWRGLVAVVLAVTGCQSAGLPPAVQPPAGLPLARAQEAEPVHVEGVLTSSIRATVNSRPILDDELREACWAQLREADQLPEPERSARQQEILKRELDKLIDREVIICEAEERLKVKRDIWEKLKEMAEKEYDKQLASMLQRSGAQNEQEFRRILAAQGMTLPNLRRQIERSFISGEYMRSRIFPMIEQIGHSEIREYFDTHPGEFQNEDRCKWQDIFIDAGSSKFKNRDEPRKLAEYIAEQAQRGADWAELSSKFNLGESSYRNGEGLGQKHGEIKPADLENTLFKMEQGQVAIVELPTGYHVIRLAQRDFAGPQPFDDKTQTEIRKKLQNLIADREYKRIAKELRGKATIQVFLNK
jgi:hypothetical protein